MEEKTCNWKNCKTKIQLDTSFESKHSMITVVGWCKKHHDQYGREQKHLMKYVSKFNGMKIKNKFGKIIRFYHGSDVSNYLFKNDKKELARILKNI